MREIRTFHASCVRRMCSVNMRRVMKEHISTRMLEEELHVKSIDTYIARRCVRWLGTLLRMDSSRLPRKLLTSWCRASRPRGAPNMTFGRSIRKVICKWIGIKMEDLIDLIYENDSNSKVWKDFIGGI